MFTLTGSIKDTPAFIQYEKGRIIGTDTAVQAIKEVASYFEGSPVGIVNQETITNHLKSPLSTYLLLLKLFDPNPILRGDDPTKRKYRDDVIY